MRQAKSPQGESPHARDYFGTSAICPPSTGDHKPRFLVEHPDPHQRAGTEHRRWRAGGKPLARCARQRPSQSPIPHRWSEPSRHLSKPSASPVAKMAHRKLCETSAPSASLYPERRRARYLSFAFASAAYRNRATITVMSSACSGVPAHSSAAFINASATTRGRDPCTYTAACCNLLIPNSSPYTFSGSTSPSLYPTSTESLGTSTRPSS